MSFRTLLLLKAVVCFVFGVPLLLAPDRLLAVLGATVAGAGLFPAREYGAAMMGTLLLCWFARGVTARDARGAILLDLLVYDAIGVVITLRVVTIGALNPLGWGIVLVYLFFTLGSAYLLMKEKPFRKAVAPPPVEEPVPAGR